MTCAGCQAAGYSLCPRCEAEIMNQGTWIMPRYIDNTVVKLLQELDRNTDEIERLTTRNEAIENELYDLDNEYTTDDNYIRRMRFVDYEE